MRDRQDRNAVSLKKVSPLDFEQYSNFKCWNIRVCAHMLVLEEKERAFIEKMNLISRFPAAILVDQNCTPIWRLHKKLYQGA